MSIPPEQMILLAVLVLVLSSVPAALLVRRFWPVAPRPYFPSLPAAPAGEGWNPGGGCPVPPLPLHAAWRPADGWFAGALLLLIALLMGPLASLAGGGSGAAEPAHFTAKLFLVQLLFQLGLTGVVIVYLSVHRRMDVVDLFGLRAMGPFRTVAAAVRWMVPGFFVIMLLAGLAAVVLKPLTGLDLKPQAIVEGAKTVRDSRAMLLLGVTLCAGAPLMEEVVFRGVLFSVAARFLGRGYALTASGLFFGVVHANLISFVPLSLLGMFFAMAYERTRTLAVPVLMHALFNGTQFFLLLYGEQIRTLPQ